jgi:hypothetical protein
MVKQLFPNQKLQCQKKNPLVNFDFWGLPFLLRMLYVCSKQNYVKGWTGLSSRTEISILEHQEQRHVCMCLLIAECAKKSMSKKVVYNSKKIEWAETHISVVIPSSIFMIWEISSRQKLIVRTFPDL